MKICFLINNISRPGGSERVTSIIASEMVKKGHDVHIFSICGENKCFYDIDKRVTLFTQFLNKEVDNKKMYFLVLFKLLKYYKENNIQISIDIFSSLSLYSIPIKLIKGIKVVTWEHFNFYVNTGMNKIARKLACKFSDYIITLTEEDRQNYYTNIKKIRANIKCIYNPSSYSNSEISKLGNKIVLTVGRLTYQKGYDMLLRAWKIIEDKSDWKLIIAGDGEEKSNLIRLKNQLKIESIEFIGAVSDIDKYYKNASIYVSSSRYEGLPMTMIEAQKFGLPIVAFDCKTGPAEIIKHEVDGLLVKCNEIESLANNILNLINSPQERRELGKNASKNSERFNINLIINEWEFIIKELESE